MTIYFYKILRKYFHRFVFYLPREVAHNIIYRSYFGKSLDLKNPRDLIAKLYGVYNRIEDIDIDILPERFVLKTTHGCCDRVIYRL